MTNFDRWKQSLTPDEVLDVFVTRRFCGLECPAKDHCLPHQRHIDPLTRRCREMFFEWANQETENDIN